MELQNVLEKWCAIWAHQVQQICTVLRELPEIDEETRSSFEGNVLHPYLKNIESFKNNVKDACKKKAVQDVQAAENCEANVADLRALKERCEKLLHGCAQKKALVEKQCQLRKDLEPIEIPEGNPNAMRDFLALRNTALDDILNELKPHQILFERSQEIDDLIQETYPYRNMPVSAQRLQSTSAMPAENHSEPFDVLANIAPQSPIGQTEGKITACQNASTPKVVSMRSRRPTVRRVLQRFAA